MKFQFEIVRKYASLPVLDKNWMNNVLGKVSVELTTENCFTNSKDSVCNMNKKTQAAAKSQVKAHIASIYTNIYGDYVKLFEKRG